MAKLGFLVICSQVPPTSTLNSYVDGLLTLGSLASPTGKAVQIGADGFFLAASTAAPSSVVTGITRGGTTYTLQVVSRDEITQLTLLQARDWKPGSGTVVPVADEDAVTNQRLVAALPEGMAVGQLVSRSRTGILQSSRRYVRLWEIRLESTRQRLGGSPVFTVDGRLAGFLNATLEPYDAQARSEAETQRLALTPQHFGPQGMTVGYALGPKILNRVVTGFLSPDRTALHPTVGILFRNRSNGGVELTSVTEGSAADRAGFQIGDVLLTVQRQPIRDSFELAARLFESEIGEQLTFDGRRGSTVFQRTLIVESLAQARKNREVQSEPSAVNAPEQYL